MPERLIKRFERVLVHAMKSIGADLRALVTETDALPFPAFRYNGSPSEWRTNLVLIRESLDDLERRTPSMKTDSTAQEIREITYAVANAMRRSDDAALNRILRWAEDHYPLPGAPKLELAKNTSDDDDARFSRIGEAVAGAYLRQTSDG